MILSMSAWRVKRKVHPGEVPVIRHVDDFPEAAATLATKTCAYVLPASIESPSGFITNNQERISLLLGALNKDHPG